MSQALSVVNVEDIEVYMEENGRRRETDFEQVRDRYYAPVEEHLRSRTSVKRKKIESGYGGRSIASARQTQGKEFNEWYEDVADLQITADVSFSDKEGAVTYEVLPRTDFRFDSVQSAPNIIRLREPRTGQKLAVREWSNYGEDMLDNVYDRPNISRDVHDEGLYESIGTPEYTSTDFEEEVVWVPELYLEAALQKEDGIYDALQETMGRPITPYNIKIVDEADDGEELFVLRDWMDNEFDGGLSGEEAVKRFGIHYGVSQTLGLLSFIDREHEFYEEAYFADAGFERPATVFGDPEFVMYTEDEDRIIGSDWRDFQEQLWKYVFAPEPFMDAVKKVKKDVIDDLQHLNGTLLDGLPQSVDPDMFPAEKRVSSRV